MLSPRHWIRSLGVEESCMVKEHLVRDNLQDVKLDYDLILID